MSKSNIPVTAVDQFDFLEHRKEQEQIKEGLLDSVVEEARKQSLEIPKKLWPREERTQEEEDELDLGVALAEFRQEDRIIGRNPGGVVWYE